MPPVLQFCHVKNIRGRCGINAAPQLTDYFPIHPPSDPQQRGPAGPVVLGTLRRAGRLHHVRGVGAHESNSASRLASSLPQRREWPHREGGLPRRRSSSCCVEYRRGMSCTESGANQFRSQRSEVQKTGPEKQIYYRLRSRTSHASPSPSKRWNPWELSLPALASPEHAALSQHGFPANTMHPLMSRGLCFRN